MSDKSKDSYESDTTGWRLVLQSGTVLQVRVLPHDAGAVDAGYDADCAASIGDFVGTGSAARSAVIDCVRAIERKGASVSEIREPGEPTTEEYVRHCLKAAAERTMVEARRVRKEAKAFKLAASVLMNMVTDDGDEF